MQIAETSKQPPAGAEPIFSRRIAPPISTRKLAGLMRRTGVSYGAGVDLLKIWEQEARRGRPAHQRHMQTIHDGIASGHELNESMAHCNGYFPKLTQVLVKVGERSGRLDTVLLRLADHYDHVLRMRREFIQAISWPAIQLALAVAAIGLLIWIMGAVLPGEIDILGWGLMGTSGLLVFLFFVSTIVAGVTLAVVGLLRGWYGQTPLQLAMRIWGIGTAMQDFALARLSWCLASSLEAGVDARESMRLALESTNNYYYTRHHRSVDKVIERGGELHESLRQTRAFPDEFLDSLEMAELSGTHSESMMRLSDEYEARARLAATLLTRVGTYVVWLIVAGIIISMIFRLAFFYLNTINSFL